MPDYSTTAIIEARNDQNGSTATCFLIGQPTGGAAALTFYAHRIPSAPDAERVMLPFGPGAEAGTYRVTLPRPGPWYVWAHDNRGFSKVCAPAYIGMSDRAELDEAAAFMRDRVILEHAPMLNIALRQQWGIAGIVSAAAPEAAGSRGFGESGSVPTAGGARTTLSPEIKQVVYGINALIEDYPSIVIHEPTWAEPYAGTNMMRQVTAGFTITGMLVHTERHTNILPGLTTLMRRLQTVLNLEAYERIILPGGFGFANCGAVESSANENYVDGIGWAAECSLRWSGQTTVQYKD